MIDFSNQDNKKYTTHGTRKAWILVSHIVYVDCCDHLLTIYLDDGSTHYDGYPLSAMEAELNDCGFFRINHSTLINLRHVTGDYTRKKQKYVLLRGKKELKIARRRIKMWNNCVTS
jgi:DNA-binding LytR/AlgR family response regulator